MSNFVIYFLPLKQQKSKIKFKNISIYTYKHTYVCIIDVSNMLYPLLGRDSTKSDSRVIDESPSSRLLERSKTDDVEALSRSAKSDSNMRTSMAKKSSSIKSLRRSKNHTDFEALPEDVVADLKGPTQRRTKPPPSPLNLNLKQVNPLLYFGRNILFYQKNSHSHLRTSPIRISLIRRIHWKVPKMARNLWIVRRKLTHRVIHQCRAVLRVIRTSFVNLVGMSRYFSPSLSTVQTTYLITSFFWQRAKIYRVAISRNPPHLIICRHIRLFSTRKMKSINATRCYALNLILNLRRSEGNGTKWDRTQMRAEVSFTNTSRGNIPVIVAERSAKLCSRVSPWSCFEPNPERVNQEFWML